MVMEANEVGRRGHAYSIPVSSVTPMEREALASLSESASNLPSDEDLTKSHAQRVLDELPEEKSPEQSEMDIVDQLISEGIPIKLRQYKETVELRVRFSMRATRDLEKEFNGITNVGILLSRLLSDEIDDADVDADLQYFKDKLSRDDFNVLRVTLYRYKGSKVESVERSDLTTRLLAAGLRYDPKTGKETKWGDPEFLIDWLDFGRIADYILALEAALLLAIPKFRTTVTRPQRPAIIPDETDTSPIAGFGEQQESISESDSTNSGE